MTNNGFDLLDANKHCILSLALWILVVKPSCSWMQGYATLRVA